MLQSKLLFILTTIILCLVAELSALFAWLISFIPKKIPAVVSDLFPRFQVDVVIEQDMLVYRIAILLAIVVTSIVIYCHQKSLIQLNDKILIRKILGVQLTTSLIVLWAFTQFIILSGASWTNIALIVSGLFAISAKVFMPELLKGIDEINTLLLRLAAHPKRVLIATVLMTVLIVNIVWIRDIQATLGAMFLTDHFYHLDTMIVSPAWAFLKGMILNVDTFTHYAIGLPIITSLFASIGGGFSYEHVLVYMMLLTIIYYVGFFSLVRFWLKSVWLAAIATVLLIKWQMFHGGVAPFIFNYPSATVLRYPLDIVLLFIILKHIHRPAWSLQVIGSLICGFSLFYMIDSGVYMAFTWIVFLVINYWSRLSNKTVQQIDILMLVGSIAVMLFSAFGLLLLTQQGTLFTGIFWNNLAERTTLFLAGHGNIPMTASLVKGKVVDGIMGYVIPVVYGGCLLFGILTALLNGMTARIYFVVIVAVYGAVSYHYYVCRSADTSYFVVAMPFVLLLSWLMLELINKFTKYARTILLATFSIVLFCLFTNHQFLYYPHWWALTSSPVIKPMVPIKLDNKISYLNHHQTAWNPALKLERNSLGETDEQIKTEVDFKSDDEFKSYFLNEFNFEQDANLIKEYTNPADKVALISSFETRILMQADRASLFYCFPLIDSRPMHMKIFSMTSLWSKTRLKRTMDQLTEAKPAYIFMEKILLTNSVPQAYTYLYPDLLVMLGYINQAYEPVGYGKFLVALKRK